MFSSLQNGSQVYLLDKSTLTLKYGQVTSVSIPKPVMSQPFGSNNTTIDLVVSANGENINLPNVPCVLSVATINGVIVSETREALDAELDGIQRTLQTHVDNRDEYIRSIERCKEVRKELNPQLAKEQAQEEKIERLETSIEEIKKMLSQIVN